MICAKTNWWLDLVKRCHVTFPVWKWYLFMVRFLWYGNIVQCPSSFLFFSFLSFFIYFYWWLASILVSPKNPFLKRNDIYLIISQIFVGRVVRLRLCGLTRILFMPRKKNPAFLLLKRSICMSFPTVSSMMLCHWWCG